MYVCVCIYRDRQDGNDEEDARKLEKEIEIERDTHAQISQIGLFR